MKRKKPVLGLRKLFRLTFPALLILGAGAVVFFGYVTYRLTHPRVAEEQVSPSHYLLTAQDVSWKAGSGWWIPAAKRAPGIVLGPGYGMNRSDALSLGSALHDAGFHLLLYARPTSSSFGVQEKQEMESAVSYLKEQPLVDAGRIGLWGVDESAYAALAVAATHPEVLAIAADSPFEYPFDFMAEKAREEFGFRNRALEIGAREIFRLVHIGSFTSANAPLPIDTLRDRDILILQGTNRKDMVSLTASLYERLQAQKEIVKLVSARTRLMSGEEMKNYDRQVTGFFRSHLGQGAGK
jgi:pimeloyl-ACP methyl ester carboxylesterase